MNLQTVTQVGFEMKDIAEFLEQCPLFDRRDMDAYSTSISVSLAGETDNLGAMLLKRCKETPHHVSTIFFKNGWRTFDWSAFEDLATRVADGLSLVTDAKDRLAILGPTQPEWGLWDMGGHLAGLTTFGIYPKQSKEHLAFVLAHSKPKVIFVADSDELTALLEVCDAHESVMGYRPVLVPWTLGVFEAFKHRRGVKSPAAFLQNTPRELRKLRFLSPDDPATLTYTSGTTGVPKAVMLSHRQIASCLDAIAQVLPFSHADLSMHFLPMAHSAERNMGFYTRISKGFAGAYAQHIGTLLDDFAVIQPTAFGSVPRIYEKAYAKIMSKAEHKSWMKSLISRAMVVSKTMQAHAKSNTRAPLAVRIEHGVHDALLWKKIRKVFGGRMRFMMIGSAPTPKHILEFFWAAGLNLCEAYGLTETVVLTHLNTPFDQGGHTNTGGVRLTTVGKVIPPMQCKIVEDGEILLKGPWICSGYWNDPEGTRDMLDEEGWLMTGDIGHEDADGFLSITDRKKHLIITAGGKNISPALIEKQLKEADALIGHVHAHGDGRHFVSALVVPAPIETLEWGHAHGCVTAEELRERTRELVLNPMERNQALFDSMAKVVQQPEFQSRIKHAVAKANTRLAQVESVRKFVLLGKDFTPGVELTPTMKGKRKDVERMYRSAFDALYSAAPTEAMDTTYWVLEPSM